jgi:hypothetical protein
MTTTAAPTTPSLLPLALRLDAVVTGLNGAAYLAAAPLLDELLGLSTGLLRGAGAFLLVFATAVWLVAGRRRVAVAAVEVVIVLNVLWAVGSIAAVLTDRFTATTLGSVWLVLQAAVVAAFAAAQFAALRRRS